MGALPKRKLSSRRRGNRRSQWNAVVLQLVSCQRCRAPHPSHHACPRCGYYKGRTAIEIPLPEEPGAAG